MIPINFQPTEKRAYGDGLSLDVHSIFLTIQGEGPFTGKPAVFVRLAGCNLQCPSCDTEYTEGRKILDVGSILCAVQDACAGLTYLPIVVITGGEPFRQNIAELCSNFLVEGFKVQIETNGTLAPQDGDDVGWSHSDITIVCSPKAGKVHSWIRERANCFKYVLSHDSVDPNDGLPILALNHTAAPRVARPFTNMPIYVQPMDAQDPVINKLNIDAVVASCLRYGYTLQLQTHKYVEVA